MYIFIPDKDVPYFLLLAVFGYITVKNKERKKENKKKKNIFSRKRYLFKNRLL